MPSERAMDFVAAEHGHVQAERSEKEREEISVKAADLADDYLERENCDKHSLPLSTRHLLFLMSEGKHLYLEELNTIEEYVRTRKEELEAVPAESDNGFNPGMRKPAPGGLSKPPPLLPTPGRPPLLEHPSHSQAKPVLLGDRTPGPLLPTPGSYPKSKPPPLLSMHSRPTHGHGPGPLPPSKRLLLGDKPGLLPTPGGPSRPNQQRR